MIARAEQDPKPLYYQEAFLDEQLADYQRERGQDYIALIEPDDFVRWVFPKLLRSRIPRYEYIAASYGYTIATDAVLEVESEQHFINVIADVLDRHGD